MNKLFDQIFEYVLSLEIIDTHEHLPYKESERIKDIDVLKEYLQHYFNRDLISAGLKLEEYQIVIDTKIPIMERWKIVEPFWEMSRYTGYGRALDISARGLYGIEKISGKTIEVLNKLFMESLKPGHYKKVLKDKSKINISLLDSNLDCDRDYFRSVYRPDVFIYPRTGSEIIDIEKELGIRICSMTDWLEACKEMLKRVFDAGAVGLKCGLAYVRTLKFDRVSYNDAEEEFNSIFKANLYFDRFDLPINVGQQFQNYMMHFILNEANKRRIPYQFHTGIQEGSGNIIYNSDPALLSNLFLEYPDVQFDIFHIGYPYQQVLSVLAKIFPNVFIDMCWAHIISPEASINALTEWLGCVPLNKISAFGGDYCFVDAVYGHQYMARENVSKALTKKVEEGLFDIEKAGQIAELLFYKNPVNIFKLDGEI